MIRAVIDASVFVSSALSGTLAQVLHEWQAERFLLIVTVEVVREYLEVLRRPKFALPPEVVDSICGYLLHKAEFVTPLERLSVVEADPKDDKFLEAAAPARRQRLVFLRFDP